MGERESCLLAGGFLRRSRTDCVGGINSPTAWPSLVKTRGTLAEQLAVVRSRVRSVGKVGATAGDAAVNGRRIFSLLGLPGPGSNKAFIARVAVRFKLGQVFERETKRAGTIIAAAHETFIGLAPAAAKPALIGAGPVRFAVGEKGARAQTAATTLGQCAAQTGRAPLCPASGSIRGTIWRECTRSGRYGAMDTSRVRASSADAIRKKTSAARTDATDARADTSRHAARFQSDLAANEFHFPSRPLPPSRERHPFHAPSLRDIYIGEGSPCRDNPGANKTSQIDLITQTGPPSLYVWQ